MLSRSGCANKEGCWRCFRVPEYAYDKDTGGRGRVGDGETRSDFRRMKILGVSTPRWTRRNR